MKKASKARKNTPPASPAAKKVAISPSQAKQRMASPTKSDPASPKIAAQPEAVPEDVVAGASSSEDVVIATPKVIGRSAAAKDVPPPSTGVTTRARARRMASGADAN